MKRYWLFCYSNYYPYGGMNDFICDYDTVAECSKAYENQNDLNYQIFDSLENIVIDSNDLFDKCDIHTYKVDDYIHNPTDKRLCKIFPIELWDK